MSSDAASELIRHARSARVVVVGGGIAGLVAALECAKVGMQVTLLERSDRLGGLLASAELDGRMVDVAADGWRVAPGDFEDLIDELGLRDRVAGARAGDTWVAGSFGTAPLPEASILGIPASPFDARVARIIGWSGVWRAYLDRLRPPLTIGAERNLGALTSGRMGRRVLERMVAPLTWGIHSVPPERVDVDRAARGLNAALTRTGSLSGAVAQQLPDDRSAPPARATLEGGMSELIDAISGRLADLEVEVRTGIDVTAIDRRGAGFAVEATGLDPDAGGEPVEADAVIVATPEPAARRLLAPLLADAEGPRLSPADLDVVTLVLDAPVLDARPRGHAVYAVPDTAAATAVIHATATWPHTAGDPHVVRVTTPARGASDAEVIAASTDAATELLGGDIGRVTAVHRATWTPALPSSALSPERDELRSALRRDPRIGVTGAWIDGTGITRVAADAKTEAERVRSALLWGGSAGDSASG